MYNLFFKRLFDFLLAFSGFVILLPLFIFITLALLIANNGKPFFFQQRPGKNDRIFKIVKFKTMNDKKDTFGNLLPPSKRITPFGAFIRKTSLDEIPQLINVLKGDMSIIGPRPLRVEYLPLYNEKQRLRHIVRPGITGLAQVNGRNSLAWEEKFELDVFYTQNCCFRLDLKILLLTIKKVIRREDVNQDNNNTMVPFGGAQLNS